MKVIRDRHTNGLDKVLTIDLGKGQPGFGSLDGKVMTKSSQQTLGKVNKALAVMTAKS